MSSLILQIQTEAIYNQSSVLELLNKALIIAKKLRLEKFEQWTELELDGYTSYDDLPKYRFVEGVLKYKNPFHGWQPLLLDDEKINSIISKRPVNQPVSEIQSLIEQGDKVKNYMLQTMPQDLDLLLRRNFDIPNYELSIHIDPSQMKGVLEAIKKNILLWSLELEKLNITGDELSFTDEEKAIADKFEDKLFNITVNVTQKQNSESNIESDMSNQNNDLRKANIGNFSNEIHDNATQQANLNINQGSDKELEQLASEINSLLNQLSQGYQLEKPQEKMEVATKAITHIEQDKSLMEKVRRVLQAGTLSALEKQLDNPATSFVIASIKEWQKNSENQ